MHITSALRVFNASANNVHQAYYKFKDNQPSPFGNRTFDWYDQMRNHRIDLVAAGVQQILNALPCVRLVRMLCLRQSYSERMV